MASEDKLAYNRIWRKNNRDKVNGYMQNWRDKNPGISRKYNLKHCFGLTIEQYNEMYESQNGCCAICKRHQSTINRTLCVDHDHDTNKIRRLLCSKCNTNLGIYEENKELFEEYLKEFK